MRMSSHRTLGLAVGRQAIAVAEVACTRGRPRLERAAQLALPADAAWDTPARVGALIREFLRGHGFSARRCVVGLEASTLAAKEKRLPEAALGAMDDILRLAAEQDFASDEQELVFDYVAGADGQGAQALLVAAPRRWVEQVRQAAEAAGLVVTAMTASALALARATGAQGGPQVVLSLGDGGCEMVVQSGATPRLMRRLPAGAAQVQGQLQRVLAGGLADGVEQMAVWNVEAAGEAAMQELAGRLGLTCRLCRAPGDLGLEGAQTGIDAGGQVPAAAALAAGEVGVDFLHSRLAPPKTRRLGKVAAWGAAAGALLIAAAVWFTLDWQSAQREVEELQSRLREKETPAKRAQEVIDQVTFGDGWFDGRLPHLQSLLAVARGFPQEGRIWATSLAVKEDMTMALSGKASGRDPVLKLVDQLSANRSLAEVKPEYIRQAERSSQEVSFVINLRFKGGK